MKNEKRQLPVGGCSNHTFYYHNLLTAGINLSQDYTREELMQIAISSGVDGIIVTADESDEMTGLINKAEEE